MSGVDINPFNDILARLEHVADRLEKGVAGGAGAGASASPAGPASAPAAAEEPAIALSFDAFLTAKLPAIEQSAKDLNAKDVTEATEMFVTSLRMLRQVLAATGRCRKPKDADWSKLLEKVLELGKKAQQACDNRSDYFHNRKSVAEALNVVTLVTSSSPPSHVQNVLESLDFHAIKVMQKKKAEPETAWIKALKAFVKDLKDWCSEECKLGLIWNAQGEDPLAHFAICPVGAAPTAPAAAAPAAKGKGRGTAPPPPKGGFTPPPPELLAKMRGDAGGSSGGGGAGGMMAVFSEIGNFKTGGLKKVTDDMKTKNRPKDDVPAAAAAPAPKAKASGAKQGGKGPRGPPIKELQRELNWIIGNQDGVPNLILEEAEKQHLVCVQNCRNTTVQIKSKVKSISIDGCERVNVICQDVISAIELVNCERCQVQTTGKVHSIAIDKCSGVNLFLPKESLAAEIVTSMSCEMNVTIPDQAGGEGDTVELPIPEQFVTRLVGPKKLQTAVSSLYSS